MQSGLIVHISWYPRIAFVTCLLHQLKLLSILLGVWAPYWRYIFKQWYHKRFVKLELSQHIGSSSSSVNNSPHFSSLRYYFVNVTAPTQFCRKDDPKVLVLLDN